MSAAGSRRRALLFAGLALGCALASTAIAARYRDAGATDYGPARPVVIVERELAADEPIAAGSSGRSLAVREVPERFVPPDALGAVEEALGSRPAVTVPAGSYLLASQLERGTPRREALGHGLRPVEVAVAAAGSLEGASAAGGPGAVRVDVVAADEPGSTVNPRVRVLARRAPLLALRPQRPGSTGIGEGPRWRATLALSRGDALAVIEAENFAREVRLLPRVERG